MSEWIYSQDTKVYGNVQLQSMCNTHGGSAQAQQDQRRRLEIVGVSPTSVIEGGGAQHIRRGSPHLSGLSFGLS
jgi:hypothetical protein